jgi:hypothetical protein
MPESANVATVRIQVLDDFLIEPDKTITLHLLPGTGYTIGTPASATITLRSNDPANSPPPRLELLPTVSMALNPPIVAPNSQLFFNIYTSGAYGPGSSGLVFLDSTAIANLQYSNLFGGLNFRIAFTSPTNGLHLLTALLSQTNGISQIATQTFRVADALIQPSRLDTISNGVPLKWFQLFTQSDFNANSSGGYMEILAPPAATNWKSALFMTASGSGAHRLSTYSGNGVIARDDVTANSELVARFNLPAGESLLQFDVTPWTQTKAGGYIGFKLQIDSTNASVFTGATFNDVYLGFFSETNDVPAAFEWLNFSGNNFFADEPIDVDLKIYDPDSRVKAVRFFEEVRVANSTNMARTNITETLLDLPPGTNFLSLQYTNFKVGTHYFGIEVATESGTTSRIFPSSSINPARAGARVHRWLGTDGDSRSFYVVDAAGRAWVWGDNSDGQLGLGFKGDPITRAVTVQAPGGRKWRQFTSNSYCAVGVTDDGAIYGMGQNMGGTPMLPTTGTDVPIAVSMQGVHFARRAGLAENALWIISEWSGLGLLYGTGVTPGTSFVDLETGGPHVLALDVFGKLWYGSGPAGFYNTFDAAAAGGVPPWTNFSTCATHSLALDAKGRLFGWGQNDAGQLPFPSGTNVPSLTLAAFPAGVTAWTKVAAGKYVSLAVDQDGRLYSWGVQGYTGSAEPWVKSKIVPVAVPSDETGWLDIATGSTFAAALSARGNLYVWGTIPASPAPRHVDLPELVTGLPDLLNTADSTAPVVTFEPTSIRASSQFQADLIAPAGSNLEIQASSDLVNWTTVTNIANAGAKTTFTAPIQGAGNLFIRVR